MTPRTLTTADGIHLSYRDESPPTPTRSTPPPAVLLLHGLAGHLGEWDDLTARLLADGHRVVRYDARGHGESTRTPADMSTAAAVRDAVALLDGLHLPSAILLGQSLGGLTALLTAAAHPSRVSSLILVEAGPAGGDPELPERIGSWLDGWPTPFPTFAQAVAHLGHEAWARGLDWSPDGTGHARVDRDTIVAAVAEPATRDYWDQWSRVTCPTLVIRGEHGTMPPEEQREMQTRRPTDTHLTVIPDASHDVHLDRPDALYKALTTFLSTAPEPTKPPEPGEDAEPPEPPEHARFAEYLRALDRVPPAEEIPLVRRILTDPDRQMARSAVLRHLDRRAASLHDADADADADVDDATWKAWANPLAEAIRKDPFLTRRLQEWTFVHTVTAPAHPGNPAATPTALATASDWLQRRLTETQGVPAPVLAFLAEHGRTRRVRAAAAARHADRGTRTGTRTGTGTAAD